MSRRRTIGRGAGTNVDVGRLAAAVRGPGTDTRTWSSLAIIMRVVVDPAHGAFAAVTLCPTGEQHIARIGSEYAGKNFGAWFPIDVDDEVLVEAPSGDPMEGLIVSKRLWSKADPPPSEIVDNPQDALIRTKEGAALKLVADKKATLQSENDGVDVLAKADIAVTSTAGAITIKATGSGKNIVIEVGAGANVNLNVGAGGMVNLAGGGKQLAMMGDTAGPYPLVCKTLKVFGS